MPWYIQLVIYLISVASTMIAFYQVDFNRFMRIGKNNFAILVWLVISLALGYLIGSLFVELGEVFMKA